MKGSLARAGLVAAGALLTTAACSREPDGLLVVSLTTAGTVHVTSISVLVTSHRDLGSSYAATFIKATEVSPKATTLGLTVPGDLGPVDVSVRTVSTPTLVGRDYAVVHAGQRDDVAVALEPEDAGAGNPDGAGDAPSQDGGADPDGSDGAGAAGGPTGPPSLANDLVAYWTMDDRNSQVALDRWHNGYNAFLHGLPAEVAWVDGKDGAAFRPGGTGWLTTMPIDVVQNGFSVTAFLNPAETPANRMGVRTIIQRQVGNGNQDDFWFGTDDNRLAFRIGQSGTVLLASNLPLDWQFVALTYDGTTARLYIGGAGASPAGEWRLNTVIGRQPRGVNIGAACHDANPEVVGLMSFSIIDNLTLYSRALETDEIEALSMGLRPF